jgi:hypothetical protein
LQRLVLSAAKDLSWFDVIAVQECRENHADLYEIAFRMGKKYRVVMSDPGDNHERLAFLYDSRKLYPALPRTQ